MEHGDFMWTIQQPFIVKTDSSAVTVGAVLKQESHLDKNHPTLKLSAKKKDEDWALLKRL